MRILLIEDDDYKASSIKKYLAETGETDILHVSSRNSGLRAIANAFNSKKPYHLVITDNYLPIYESMESFNEIDEFACDIVNNIRNKYGHSIYVCVCSSEYLTDECDYDSFIKYDSLVYLQNKFDIVVDKAKMNIQKQSNNDEV